MREKWWGFWISTDYLSRGSKILETRERVSVKGNPLTYKYTYLSGSRTSLEYLM